MNKKGAYVVVEGPEFAGKTIHSKRLAEETNSLWVREPGYTAFGNIIRNLVLNPSIEIDPDVELVLLAADKAITFGRVVLPATLSGESVVSDRSWVSTIAYQCYGDGVERERADEVLSYAIGSPEIVDKYVFLDLEPHVAKERSSARALEYDQVDRFESQGEQYHERVRQGYLDVAKELGTRAVVLNASSSVEEVYGSIYDEVGELLERGVTHE